MVSGLLNSLLAPTFHRSSCSFHHQPHISMSPSQLLNFNTTDNLCGEIPSSFDVSNRNHCTNFPPTILQPFSPSPTAQINVNGPLFSSLLGIITIIILVRFFIGTLHLVFYFIVIYNRFLFTFQSKYRTPFRLTTISFSHSEHRDSCLYPHYHY